MGPGKQAHGRGALGVGAGYLKKHGCQMAEEGLG